MTTSYFLTVRRDRGSRDHMILSGGERLLWHGRCAVAEFSGPAAVDAGPSRWQLPPATEVLVTDRRLAFAYPVRPVSAGPPRVWPPYRTVPSLPDSPPDGDGDVAAGEVRWQWPHHLALHPGDAARAPRLGLVCEGRGTRPMLVLAGGDVATVSEADRLANLVRRAVAQFRLDHATMLGLPTAEARMLARLLIDPEFANYPGGAGQSVHVPGAVRMAGGATVVPPVPAARAS